MFSLDSCSLYFGLHGDFTKDKVGRAMKEEWKRIKKDVVIRIPKFRRQQRYNKNLNLNFLCDPNDVQNE
jgi:hypothetical protein